VLPCGLPHVLLGGSFAMWSASHTCGKKCCHVVCLTYFWEEVLPCGLPHILVGRSVTMWSASRTFGRKFCHVVCLTYLWEEVLPGPFPLQMVVCFCSNTAKPYVRMSLSCYINGYDVLMRNAWFIKNLERSSGKRY